MATLTAFEAKTRFGELLERVSRGEEIVITRHDKPVARIVPEGNRRLTQVRAAVQDLRALQQEIGKRSRSKPITDKEIKDAINEGRP
jgi:prevent-host-death family protein